MIPSLEDFATNQQAQESKLPIEVWLSERAILDETKRFLLRTKKPVAIVHKYLVIHYGYADVWETEKPIRELMNKVKKQA